MAQEQYVMHEREAQNLQKRNQQLHEQYTRLGVVCNHAAERLASANSQIERLRNECSNVRAKKKIWEVRSYGLARQLSGSNLESRMYKPVYSTKTRFYLWNGRA